MAPQLAAKQTSPPDEWILCKKLYLRRKLKERWGSFWRIRRFTSFVREGKWSSSFVRCAGKGAGWVWWAESLFGYWFGLRRCLLLKGWMGRGKCYGRVFGSCGLCCVGCWEGWCAGLIRSWGLGCWSSFWIGCRLSSGYRWQCYCLWVLFPVKVLLS